MSNLRGLACCFSFSCLSLFCVRLGAEDTENEPPLEEQIAAGHSYHGEVFNEGPRQRAVLMGGTGHVRFPVTTSNKEAQQFVSQGLGQLYGFWYLEAERSFRQAAALDPQCAMAYWGAAQANKRNSKRAKGFMAKAMKLRDKVSKREQMYLDAFNKYINADSKKKKENSEAYARDLEKILYEFPDDVEAKALLALQLYLNRSAGSKITSYMAIDALIGEVFQVQPLHSAHHFRIHLWDYERPQKALESAAKCGAGSPSIAHMWHMPGHIYSRLKRYNEAVWQQEASARTDHANMMRDRVMPDEIHNFAHNNEWLIRNLVFVGRAGDALDLAKNMLELPRHPRYNSLVRRGSADYGRRRLIEVLRKYELWEQVVALGDTPYLEPGSTVKLQVERLALLGEARFRLDNREQGEQLLKQVRQQLQQKQAKQGESAAASRRKFYRSRAKQLAVDDDQGRPLPPWEEPPKPLDAKLKKELDKAVAAARKPLDADIRELQKAVNRVEGWKTFAEGDAKAALVLLRKAGGMSTAELARIQFAAGEQDKALESVQKYLGSHKNEVLPLASHVELLMEAGREGELKKQFELLRTVAANLDLDTPVAQRLAEVAQSLGYSDDWRKPFKYGDDFGQRPDLDTLGPFRWQPSPAPSWTLKDAAGNNRSLTEFKGRPVVVIFYLGYGCLHCAEQLQKFAPMMEQFQQAGIEMIAVSSDDMDGLQISIEDYKPGRLPIPLVADPELGAFKAFRAYDDFERQSLHGTFLIDGDGLVRWQDISYEPFMDPEFLLDESKRLLNLDPQDDVGEVAAK